MDDSELSYWGAYGRGNSMNSLVLDGMGPMGDIVQIWNVIGAIIERMEANE